MTLKKVTRGAVVEEDELGIEIAHIEQKGHDLVETSVIFISR